MNDARHDSVLLYDITDIVCDIVIEIIKTRPISLRVIGEIARVMLSTCALLVGCGVVSTSFLVFSFVAQNSLLTSYPPKSIKDEGVDIVIYYMSKSSFPLIAKPNLQSLLRENRGFGGAVVRALAFHL